jgi:hypothetical protein
MTAPDGTARDGDPVRLVQELALLETEYWYDVDHNWGRTAHELYLDDGLFAIGKTEMSGRDAIRQFYRWRESRGERTARHVVTNFRARLTGVGQASFECILMLFAADGAPVLESRPAIMIADIVGDCVRNADGAWRYRRHRLHPIFMGGEAPTIPPGGGQP